jgi:hypothetical protein
MVRRGVQITRSLPPFTGTSQNALPGVIKRLQPTSNVDTPPSSGRLYIYRRFFAQAITFSSFIDNRIGDVLRVMPLASTFAPQCTRRCTRTTLSPPLLRIRCFTGSARQLVQWSSSQFDLNMGTVTWWYAHGRRVS